MRFFKNFIIFCIFCSTIVHLKEISLEEVQKIGVKIPNGIPSLTKRQSIFNCDTWQGDFTNELLAEKIPHEKCNMKLRPKDNKGPTVIDAEIRFNNIQVGYDTHFYTKVKIGQDVYIFDNFNIKGIKESEHKAKRTFWYSKTGADNSLIQVQEEGNIKVNCKAWVPKTPKKRLF